MYQTVFKCSLCEMFLVGKRYENFIPDNTIDNLKLNKLLYYVQGFSLVKLGYPMFDENIQAWDYGPVIPEIYHVFKCCGKNSIEEPTAPFDESRFSTEELNLPSFTVDNLNLPTVTELPADWDRKEDSIYDTV